MTKIFKIKVRTLTLGHPVVHIGYIDSTQFAVSEAISITDNLKLFAKN